MARQKQTAKITGGSEDDSTTPSTPSPLPTADERAAERGEAIVPMEGTEPLPTSMEPELPPQKTRRLMSAATLTTSEPPTEPSTSSAAPPTPTNTPTPWTEWPPVTPGCVVVDPDDFMGNVIAVPERILGDVQPDAEVPDNQAAEVQYETLPPNDSSENAVDPTILNAPVHPSAAPNLDHVFDCGAPPRPPRTATKRGGRGPRPYPPRRAGSEPPTFTDAHF